MIIMDMFDCIKKIPISTITMTLKKSQRCGERWVMSYDGKAAFLNVPIAQFASIETPQGILGEISRNFNLDQVESLTIKF